MKCLNCNGEFNPPEGFTLGDCPFCHKPLIQPPDRNNIKTAADALAFIAAQYGTQTLLNSGKLTGLFSDLLPDAKAEKNFIRNAFAAGIPEMLYGAVSKPVTERRIIVSRCVEIMVNDFLMAEDKVEKQILIFAKVLGWEDVPPQNVEVKRVAPPGIITANEHRGNTVGNIVNGGWVAAQGDWVYFISFVDELKTYKIHLDGSKWQKFNDDISIYMNVVNDWVYYSNGSDGGKLYKICINGKERQKINNDASGCINIVNNWVYYSNGSDRRKLYKIRIDGSERHKINNDNCEYINVVNDWVYYRNCNDGYKLYKIHTNGRRRKKINNDCVGEINVVNDWIYYLNYSDGHKIYKIRLDGSERQKLTNENSSYLNVANDWIYYAHHGLCKIRTDGSERQELDNSLCGSIFMVNDWVYYFNIERNIDELYKICADGTGREEDV